MVKNKACGHAFVLEEVEENKREEDQDRKIEKWTARETKRMKEEEMETV